MAKAENWRETSWKRATPFGQYQCTCTYTRATHEAHIIEHTRDKAKLTIAYPPPPLHNPHPLLLAHLVATIAKLVKRAEALQLGGATKSSSSHRPRHRSSSKQRKENRNQKMGDYALGEIYLIETLVRTLKYSQRYNYVLMKSQVLPIHCLSRE